MLFCDAGGETGVKWRLLGWGLFFVLCGSIFDMILQCAYVMMVLGINGFIVAVSFSKTTTYLTIDSSGVHGNNGYKTAKEHLPWNRNRYKKLFVAKSA